MDSSMDPNMNDDSMQDNQPPLSQELPGEVDISVLDYPPPAISLTNLYWCKSIISPNNSRDFQIIEDLIDLWNFLIGWNNQRNETGNTPEYLYRNPLSAEKVLQGEYTDYAFVAYALALPLDWFSSRVGQPIGFGKTMSDPAIIKPEDILPERLSVEFVVKYWSLNRSEAEKSEWIFQSDAYRAGNPFACVYASHIVYYERYRPSLPNEDRDSTYYGWMRIALALHFLNWMKDVLFSHLGSSRAQISSGLMHSERALRLKKFRNTTYLAENIIKPDFMKQTICRSSQRHAGLSGTSSLMNANRMHPSASLVISGFYQLEHERVAKSMEGVSPDDLVAQFKDDPDRFEPEHRTAHDICARLLFENCRRAQHTLSWSSLFQSHGIFPLGGSYTDCWTDLIQDNVNGWKEKTPAELYRLFLQWNNGKSKDTSGSDEFTEFFSRILNDVLGTLYSKTILSPQDPETFRINLDLLTEDEDSLWAAELSDLAFIKIGNDNLPVHEFVTPSSLSESISQIDFSASAFRFRDPTRFRLLLDLANHSLKKKQRHKPY
jgi:hypothetical protein